VKQGHHFFQTFATDCRKLVSSADFLAVQRSVLPRRQIILAVQRNICPNGKEKKEIFGFVCKAINIYDFSSSSSDPSKLVFNARDCTDTVAAFKESVK
jgi:hypothetical protein